jgi:hypothetical protein
MGTSDEFRPHDYAIVTSAVLSIVRVGPVSAAHAD